MLTFIINFAHFFITAIIHAPFPYLILQGCLLGFVIWYLKGRSSKPVPEKSLLTREEEDAIIEKWKPKGLLDSTKIPPEEPSIFGPIEGRPGKYVSVDGINYLNLATQNYLGIVEEKDLDIEAERCIKKYGVGSCGPRGFYGTADVHLTLEKNLARFMNLEETALYSYGFSTIASAIPSYAKADDVIFADEYVNFSIINGMHMTKAKVFYFKHNNMQDFERVLNEQARIDNKDPKKAKNVRRFCIVEGIYWRTGEMCPLRDVNRLCKQHKVRLFLDETISFATLGPTGRGITEHLNIPMGDMDMILGSMENALAAYGGFVIGSSYVVSHQRLSGLGYCFSASMPPLLAGAGLVALDKFERNPSMVQELQENCVYMHNILKTITAFNIPGHQLAPIKHLQLRRPSASRKDDKATLNKIITHVKDHDQIALCQPACIEDMEIVLTPPSIRLAVNRLLTKEDMMKVGSALQGAVKALNL